MKAFPQAPSSIFEDRMWKTLTYRFADGLYEALAQQHHAAQFIALAGRHLIPQRSDDSNTSMRYLIDKEVLAGDLIDDRVRITLNLKDLTLCLADEQANCLESVGLTGKTKQEAFEAFSRVLAGAHADVSSFKDQMHYEIPEHGLDKGSPFFINKSEFFIENDSYRYNAGLVIDSIVSGFGEAAPVRVWPHHFDTGSVIPIEKNKNGTVTRSIGLGWAIPDAMVDEPYFYLSIWSDHPLVDFKNLPSPAYGEWIRTGWTGGVLKLSEILEESMPERQYSMVRSFFNTGMDVLINNLKPADA